MPRPLYKSESDAMGVLFFDNEEGAVPAYLNTGSAVPRVLGAIVNTTPTVISNRNTVLTTDLLAQSDVSQVQKTVTPDVVNTMTNPPANTSSILPPGAIILQQLNQQMTEQQYAHETSGQPGI